MSRCDFCAVSGLPGFCRHGVYIGTLYPIKASFEGIFNIFQLSRLVAEVLREGCTETRR